MCMSSSRHAQLAAPALGSFYERWFTLDTSNSVSDHCCRTAPPAHASPGPRQPTVLQQPEQGGTSSSSFVGSSRAEQQLSIEQSAASKQPGPQGLLGIAGLLAAPSCRARLAAAVSGHRAGGATRQPHHPRAQLLECCIVADAQHLAAGHRSAGTKAVKQARHLPEGARKACKSTSALISIQRCPGCRLAVGCTAWSLALPPGLHRGLQLQEALPSHSLTRCWLVSSSAASTSSIRKSEVEEPAMATCSHQK